MDDNINEMQYIPAFASVKEDKEVDQKEFEEWYENTYKKIPLETRLALSGKEAFYEVRKVCRVYEINGWKEVGLISRIIRDVICEKISDKEIKKRAIEKVGISESEADKFVEKIHQATEKIKKAGKEEYDNTIKKISLEEALDFYPEIKDMEITESSIELEDKKNMQPGTLETWLLDYFETAGGKKHSNFERNEYLFDSKDAQKLDSTEKERLGILLKVYDENGKLAIDREDKVVNFEETKRINQDIFSLDKVMDSYDEPKKSATGTMKRTKKSSQSSEETANIREMQNTPAFDSDADSTLDNPAVQKSEAADSGKKFSFEKTLNLRKGGSNESSGDKKKTSKKGYNTVDLSDYI